MVIQAALLVAVHAQPLAINTVALPLPDVDATVCASGDTVAVHVPACVIVTVWPATVRVLVRDVVPVFAATE